MIFGALVVISLLLLVALPYPYANYILLGWGAAAFTAAIVYAQALLARAFEWVLFTRQPLPVLVSQPHKRLTQFQMAVEIGVVVGAVLWATRPFYMPPPKTQYTGNEAEWLTNSIYVAHNGLQQYGRIPLWNPWLESGEPLIENPFSFILNPFSSAPGLLLGGERGVLLSVAITACVAALGGWFLGWVVEFGLLGRLLLALLVLGKGNMHAMFNTGYFQLATGQAYFPWIVAGTVAIFRLPDKRWPAVMTAMGLTLLWFAGNIWYILPMVIMVMMIGCIYGLSRRRVEWRSVRRLILAGGMTAGLSMITLLPLAVHWDQIGRHQPILKSGWEVDLGDVLSFYVNGDHELIFKKFNPANQGVDDNKMADLEPFYYSFVVPAWFALLLIIIPVYRSASIRGLRLGAAAVLMFVICTLWGAGGQPLFVWLYTHLEFFRGWRFVGRALAASGFCLAILVAMRADSLWRILRDGNEQGLRARWFVMLALLMVSGLAVYETNKEWSGNHINLTSLDDLCISRLRQMFPDQPLAAWHWGYEGVTTYLNHEVRKTVIGADFTMLPLPSTIGGGDLTHSLPEFAMIASFFERDFILKEGYQPIAEDLRMNTEIPCLYRKPDALPYAYTLSLDKAYAIPPETDYDANDLNRKPQVLLPPGSFTPVPRSNFARQPDNIALVVNGDPLGHVLTVQERDYPGWRAAVDGWPARVESVGGQIGVILPRDSGPHTVYFEFRPPLLLLGGIITLLSAAGCILYLLLPRLWFKKRL